MTATAERRSSLVDDVDWPIRTERLLLRPATLVDIGATLFPSVGRWPAGGCDGERRLAGAQMKSGEGFTRGVVVLYGARSEAASSRRPCSMRTPARWQVDSIRCPMPGASGGVST
jgi:hypothetical protein